MENEEEEKSDSEVSEPETIKNNTGTDYLSKDDLQVASKTLVSEHYWIN